MFGAVYAAEGSSFGSLLATARDFSPRVEPIGDREVTLDLHGLERLIGDARTIAAELRRAAADRGLRVRAAVAGTRTAARLLVHAHPGLTIAERGDERRALAHLSIDLLALVADPESGSPHADRGSRTADLLLTLRRWGVRTLGDLADLPDDEIAARLGQRGVAWQRLARGEDPRPLVPAGPEERFEQALDLEWPIDGLEPLSFVLGRLMEPLSIHLERRDRAAAVLHVRLHLVKTGGVAREVHERSLQLPAPVRDARTLRTLALLDLESHPPAAAIDRVVVAVDPTPGRVVQFSLLARPLPSAEQLSTLMARLQALMGEDRCGAPAEVDSWQPGAFEMRPFAPSDALPPRRGDAEHTTPRALCVSASPWPCTALRRFRHPVAIRMRLDEGRPSRVAIDRRGLAGGRVDACAGPWRTSGAWWKSPPWNRDEREMGSGTISGMSGGKWCLTPFPWNRDEWDVTLEGGETYRVFHDRDSGNWFLDGVVD